MEIKYSFVCDYSTRDIGDKLIVIGIFDKINARQFPTTHPSFFYVAGLKYRASESGRNHKFEVCLVDADGKNIAPPLKGELAVPSNSNNGIANLIVNFNGVVFPKAGTYSLDLMINGENKVFDNIDLTQVTK